MRALKILGIVAGSVVGLLIIAAILVAWLFDPNDYKDYVTSWVEERTGRSLRIQDDLELEFFPWLAVETGGITIGNSPEFPPEQPFATIDRISARVRLVPLLQREFDIGTVTIDGLELDLAMDAEGRSNWDDLLARANDTEPSTSTGDASERATFDADGVLLRGASVTWRDASGEIRYALSELFLETSSINLARPTDIDLRLDLLDVPTQLTAHIEASSNVALDADGGFVVRDLATALSLTDGRQRRRAEATLEMDEATITGAGDLRTASATVSGILVDPPFGPAELPFSIAWEQAALDATAFDLSITGVSTTFSEIEAEWRINAVSLLDQRTVSGTVTVADGSLAGLLRLLSQPVPAGVSAAELGEFDLSTSFTVDADARSVVLTNAIANALGANVRTDQATISQDLIDANIGIAPFRPSDTLRAILSEYLPSEIDFSAVQRLALSAEVNADLEAGSTAFDDVQAELLGASVSGSMTIVEQADGSELTGTLTTNRFLPTELVAVLDAYLADGVNVDQLGNVAASGDFSYNTGTDSAIVRTARLEAFGLNMTGQLEATSIRTGTILNGRVQISQFEPRELLTRFGLATPQSSDPEALSTARAETGFEITPTRGRFDDLVARFDDTTVNGIFVVDEFDDPSYRLELSVDQIDVDRYLPPQQPRGSEQQTTERRAGDLRIDAEPLRELVVNGRISVGALRLAGMDFEDVATNLSVGGGRLAIESAQANLYGGSFNGVFLADATAAEPSVSLVGRAESLELEPLIDALTGDANFSGTGDFDIDLTGHGETMTENLRSAAGSMGFRLRDGAIDGFSIEHRLCGYYNTLRQLPRPAGGQPERTAYEIIEGTATVSDGIASSNDLLARTRTMQVRGTGRLSLVEQLADYAFEAQISESVPIAGCDTMDRLIGIDFPLTLEGPVTDPEIEPDYSEILERFARDEIEDALRDRLEERLLDIFD